MANTVFSRVCTGIFSEIPAGANRCGGVGAAEIWVQGRLSRANNLTF